MTDKSEGPEWRVKKYIAAKILTEADLHVARYVANAVVPEASDQDLLCMALAVGATQRGHVCANLLTLKEFAPVVEARDETDRVPKMPVWPAIHEWEAHLESSNLVHIASSWDERGSTRRPLMFFAGRLYLSRQWEDERIVAQILGRRLSAPGVTVDDSSVERVLAGLFADAESDDKQVQAVRTSLVNGTSVLMGGPGTGKTYTIARILSAHLSLHGSERPLRIALAAPTAKAAARMRESLLQAAADEDNPLPDEHREIFRVLDPTTIHGLLGRRRHVNTRFAHDDTNPLDFDLIVIDEMSMVSLALMARLLEALHTDTRLVLVGDPGQLASVENGSILVDLARLEEPFGHLITRLEVSRRNRQTASSAFTEAIRAGRADRIKELLSASPSTEATTLEFVQLEKGLQGAKKEAVQALIARFAPVRTAALAGKAEDAVAAAGAIRILCAHRHGDFGVEKWNRRVNEELFEGSSTWTPGQIVIKTRNDLANGLANGESGVVVTPLATSETTSDFAFARGSDILRKPTAAVDDIELAFATTVHKAQGSEFATVIVVVPPETSPLCTRELLYTAATRAKPNLILVGHRDDVLHAVGTERPRFSGLVERLQQPLEG